MSNAFAAANLTTSSADFGSADPARADSYMDVGGVWDGFTEVSNIGDTFTLTIANTAGGLPATDTAFDLQDVIVTVAAGFNLASNVLNINNVTGGSCPNILIGNAQQTGTQVTLNVNNNQDVLPGCTYELEFGLTTSTAVTAGSYPVNYSISYDDDGGNPQSTPVVQSIDVNTGALSVTKTTATVTAVTTDVITYDVTVNSTGAGGLFDVQLNDILSADLNGLSFNVPNPPAGAGAGNNYTFEYLAAGQSVNLTVEATVTPLPASTCPVLENTADLSERTGIAIGTTGPVAVQYDFQFTSGPFSNVISHDATSYCEFCGDGVVSITVQNPTSAPLTNITLREDLLASGLVYIAGTATVNASLDNPGIVGNVLTWNLPDLAGLGSHVITFGVRSSNAENLITAVRDITATVDFDMSCLAATQSVNTGLYEVPIRQPIPTIFKDGRNYDAGQTVISGAAYTDPVYGSFNDDVIWQVNIANAGLAHMQALQMNDSINGNFTINYICKNEGDAEAIAIANGAGPGACIPFNSSYNVADPFGNIADPDDVATISNYSIFYVGRVDDLNTDNINTADISWGCDVALPAGGLITVPASNGGSTPPVTITDPGVLNTDVTPAGLIISQTVTGSNPGQPDLGSKGLITITLENQTGGSIQGINALQGIRVSTNLPAGYVLDESYGVVNGVGIGQPTRVLPATPAYGVIYPGFIDTITRDDPELNNGNVLDDLNPTFALTSSTTGVNLPQQQNMLRHGDIVSFTFGVVMIEPTRFDLVSDLEVAPENTGDGTDPTNALALSNDVFVTFNSVDSTGPQAQTRNETFNYNSSPEDLDVSISDALFILTNDTGAPLPLNVILTNNGLHDADDYSLYVSFGQAMVVQTPAPGCSLTSNAPPHPTWNIPEAIPGPLTTPAPKPPAAIYLCNRGTIAPGPGQEETFTFQVIKQVTGVPEDDLTFRADVIGEVTLFDGNRLTYSGTPASPNLTPPSLSETSPSQQLANNYTLDAVRSRVLGFNLVKSVWYCTENGIAGAPPVDPGPPAGDPLDPIAPPADLNSQIGEDCSYRIESGGWFGFKTPGFTVIAVENVAVTDDLPDGQGFIPFGGGNYNFTLTGNISLVGADGGATSTPLDENDITWNFNATGSGIIIKDEFFRVDFKTRLLNDPVDLAYPVPGGYAPNLHDNSSINIARTSFDAIFNSSIGNRTIAVSDGAGIPGYPVPGIRTVELFDVEPNLIVTKQVCNETLSVDAGNGSGANCVPFLDTVNNGDTNDSYIYRITLTNENDVPVRSPAYNVISTDTLDASGLMLVDDFTLDGLDNDGDGVPDPADLDEGSIAGNTIGVPAVITIDESHSAPLLQVDAGDTVTFLYRVDPHISIAPLQSLTNRVSMSYDSLEGDSGNQDPPYDYDNSATAPNDVGRARIYTTIEQTANVVMVPLVALPKIVVATANTPIAGTPQEVSVGEELRYLLVADLPVANLRDFKIRDELPAGVRCIEGQQIDLNSFPYSAAGFVPGGIITPTCTSTGANDYIEWNFGDQAVTLGMPGARFNFPITFIAQVENTGITDENVTLTNGGGVVNTTPPPSLLYCTGGVGVCYVDDMGSVVALDFAPVDIVVREPVITLTKSFLPVVSSDAADVLTVTVTARNDGTAPAYNLQILDDLVGSDMTYINDSMLGANVPDDDGVTADSKNPIFSWNLPPLPLAPGTDYEILPGETKTFTFQVRVDITAQPLETLDNTLQAKWDSLPDRTVALNTITGTIGPDGSEQGLRNGVIPHPSTPDSLNDYVIAASTSTEVPPLNIIKTDRDTTVVPTIGAHRNFEVIIELPEGTTENLVIDDQLLMAAGVSYVLSRNTDFEVDYVFEDIVSINGLPPAEAVFRGATAGPPTLPADGDSGTITWDIGQVITAEEDDLDAVANTINPRIIIRYYARPNNDLATNAGGTMQNSATANYDHGEGGAAPSINDTTAVQTVLEPSLGISKTVSNSSGPGLPVAGDVLEYQVSITNTGGSTAFDSNIVDTLDDNLLFDSSAASTPTAFLGGSAVTGFVAAPTITAAPASTLTWGRANADNTLDIPVGSTLVLTYYAVVQNTIQPNVDIVNSALVDWTSLDDTDTSSAFERTGAGCPTVVAPDIYCSAPAVATITALNSNSIDKSVTGDTYIPPLGVVRVGDIITYQLDVNIQQGTTASVNIRDAIELPGTGLVFEEIVSINGATSAPYTSPVASNFKYTPIPATDVPAVNDRLVFNWALGTIINEADADATNDRLVIIYRARVVENDPDTIPQIPTATVPPALRNTADLTFMDGNNNPVSGLNSFADISVVQPLMDLSKTDRSGRVSGDPVNVATDIMNFQLESCNNGDAPAYGLKITDTLPTELDNTSLTVPVVTIGGNPAIDGVHYDYVAPPAGAAGRGGDLEFTFSTPIAPTECATIIFDIGFYTDFGFGNFSNQVVVNEYYSLPPADAQLYGPLGPEFFIMNNPATLIPPPVKVKSSADEATIGDEVVYTITVPGVATGTILYDINVTDVLHDSLFFVSAIDTGASGFTIVDTMLPGNTVNLYIDQIPAGQQAIIQLRARVDNNAFAQEAIVFDNAASYTYADSTGGPANNAGTSGPTGTPVSITEPLVDVLKSVENIIKPGLPVVPPDAGDILRYSITLTASGGAVAPADFFSEAFDVSLDDTLSLGLLFIDGTQSVDGGSNSIGLPVKVGDGVTTAQTLSWSLEQANADIDVVEGTTVTVSYDVLVLDSVLADQNLSNSVDIQWSSRDGPNVPGGSGEFERDGSGLPLNDYYNFTPAVTLETTLDSNTIVKTRISDTYDPVTPNDNIVRIGDIVEYQLVINMQEGTSPDFLVEDTLDEGLIFEGTVSINGQPVASPAVSPFSHAVIPAAIVSGDPATGPTSVSWTPGGDILNPGDVINAGDNDITNDDFVIVYRARVLNLALTQTPTSTPLNNNVDFDYAMDSGPVTKTSSQQLELQQPDLAITKTSVPVANSVIGVGDPVTYTVEITNNGDSPAYDTELLDTLPFGMRNAGITMVSVQLTSGTPFTPLPAAPLAPVFDPVTGNATWNFDSGIADQYNIPVGDTLQIVYTVQADAGLGAGVTLTNSAQVQFYYSFDNNAPPSLAGINGVREIYGPTAPAQVDLLTTPAEALLKTNPTDLDVSIGETFTYRITVPDAPQLTALYDVQILDNLVTDSAADLMFVSVAAVGTPTWTPVNIGTVTDNLIIADITNGIDIPAMTQIAVDVTVTLRNSLPPNDTSLQFSNTATYTFNRIDGDDGTVSNGPGNTTPLMNVVEPNLTLLKTGPAGNVNFTAPIPYTVVIENVGDGPAFDTTIIDTLPAVPDNAPLTGGTCNATPTITSINIFENDGTTPAVRPAPALALGIDYNVTYTAAPTCELVITTLSDKARIEATEKLIVEYETTLDVATQSGAELTNVAGVTQWFSLNTAGAGATDEIREYNSVLTSSVTVTVEAPVLDFEKTVVLQNDVNGDGIVNPGDTLRYSLFIENTGPTALPDFSLIDDVDGLAPASGFFASGSMTNIVVPAGADASNTNIAGGTNSAGLLDVRNLSIDEAGGASPTVLIEFDITLLPVIDSNTIVLNQAQLDSPSTGILLSDYPVTPGANEPTPIPVISAPAFLVQKVSTDITGDPTILQPGDTLSYTLTVKNIGQENAINSLLSDQIPANTTYVANSTRLNTAFIADPLVGVSALAGGMLINAPENTTPGYLRADTDPVANNVAVITFDVIVNPAAVSGTIISNQGFFSGAGAGSGVFPQQPSDDPATALVNDPTIDVVGNVPVITALKTVAIENDDDGNGFVSPGDTLRYTITTTNIGAMPATNVVLTDNLDLPVAGQITYVPGSGLLNGLPAGVSFSAPVLTAVIGDLLPANSAVVIFDVVVNAGVLPGTIISNQGSVASNELPVELTDADGDNTNGYQTTDVVVGNVQQLAITKQVSVVGGGAAEPGTELEYVVRVTNIGSITATNVVIESDLDDPDAGQITYVPGSGLLDGLVTGVSLVGSTVTVNYGDLPAGAVTELRFRALLDSLLLIGDTVTKTTVATWDAPLPVSATVSIDIGGIPGSAIINGQVWHDTDFSNDVGTSEIVLQDYSVQLFRNNILLASTLTDVNGVFLFIGLPPNILSSDPYEVRYQAPDAVATTASLGTTNSPFTDGPQRITDIYVASGTNVQGLNLPRQVNGIVYDSILRSPVAGVQLSMINQTRSNQPVPDTCFNDPVHANQVTLAGGYYKFDLNFSDPARCAQGDEYEILVQPPADDFTGTTSVIIPPVEPVTGVALDVPNCPGAAADKISATAQHCENSASNLQPPATVAPRTPGTDYHLKFLFSDVAPGTPFTDQIYNNHIPVDGVIDAAVAISKVAGKLNVTRSDLVPYTITFNNTLGVPLFDVSIIDNFPAGFKYVTGSARVDGAEAEPDINGRTLTWSGLSVDINESSVIKLLLVVGSGVGEGEYVNRARAINTFTGADLSGTATATVRVIPDPTFDCTDIIGKVFDDKNLNAYQDQGEMGIPGVQVATARGLRVTTDRNGRFHITCAIVANEVRGSNFIMKLDDRTLPSGYRVTTENPRVQRATRGKMMKFNFGTAIHRVVRLDLADGVFEKGSTELRPQWQSRIELLITELQKEGSILRLAYLAENETEDEVEDRLDAIEDLVSDRWADLDCCYKLTIEQEVFWRKGGPSAGREFD